MSRRISSKHLWICAAVAALAVGVAVVSGSGGYLLFVIPCMLMMGAMMWMMMGGSRGGDQS